MLVEGPHNLGDFVDCGVREGHHQRSSEYQKRGLDGSLLTSIGFGQKRKNCIGKLRGPYAAAAPRSGEMLPVRYTRIDEGHAELT